MDDSVGMPPKKAGKPLGGKVTIRDLAERLDLTKGTVSRALNGYSDISHETRKRVAEAAEAMGYRPSTQARAIRTGRCESVGLVLNVDEDNAYKPFLSDFLDGISRRLGRAGWTLSVATAFSSDEALAIHQRLAAEKKVDGFILPRTKVKDARVALCRELDVPFVLYGRTADSTGCSWFDIRGETAMHDAVQRLADMGHQQIAYVGAKIENNFQKLRLKGFRDGLAAMGLAADPVLELAGAMSDQEGYDAAMALMDLREPPTAIICALDRAALGVCRALRVLGLTPGRDVSVIGYDGIPEGQMADPKLTTFAVDMRHAGERLADLLIRRIKGAAPDDLREEANATLIAGGTDGPPEYSVKELAANIAAKRAL